MRLLALPSSTVVPGGPRGPAHPERPAGPSPPGGPGRPERMEAGQLNVKQYSLQQTMNVQSCGDSHSVI